MANKYLPLENNMGKQHCCEQPNKCFEIALTPSQSSNTYPMGAFSSYDYYILQREQMVCSKKKMRWLTVCPWRETRVSSELQPEALGCQKGKDVAFPSKKKL